MSRHSGEEFKGSPRHSFQVEHDEDERKGLLSDSPRVLDEDELVQTPRSRKRAIPWVMAATAGTIITIVIICMLYGESFLDALTGNTSSDSIDTESRVQFDCAEIHTNGTHDFKKTAIIVSIDGLR